MVITRHACKKLLKPLTFRSWSSVSARSTSDDLMSGCFLTFKRVKHGCSLGGGALELRAWRIS